MFPYFAQVGQQRAVKYLPSQHGLLTYAVRPTMLYVPTGYGTLAAAGELPESAQVLVRGLQAQGEAALGARKALQLLTSFPVDGQGWAIPPDDVSDAAWVATRRVTQSPQADWMAYVTSAPGRYPNVEFQGVVDWRNLQRASG